VVRKFSQKALLFIVFNFFYHDRAKLFDWQNTTVFQILEKYPVLILVAVF